MYFAVLLIFMIKETSLLIVRGLNTTLNHLKVLTLFTQNTSLYKLVCYFGSWGWFPLTARKVTLVTSYCVMMGRLYIEMLMLRMELAGKRKRGRHKMRFMYEGRRDTIMTVVEVTKEDAEDMTEWRLENPV